MDLTPLSRLLPSILATLRVRKRQPVEDPNDIEKIIVHQREALAPQQPTHPHRSATLNSLGAALRAQFFILEDLNNLEDAVKFHRESLATNSFTAFRPYVGKLSEDFNSVNSNLITERLGLFSSDLLRQIVRISTLDHMSQLSDAPGIKISLSRQDMSDAKKIEIDSINSKRMLGNFGIYFHFNESSRNASVSVKYPDELVLEIIELLPTREIRLG
ncbi:hypothetical protein B0H13DRAFT_1908826 [Mycena leptocephala]|nr:hypothetical protein B0H13DRAFT_1908826 [Mycena leptocephala]